MRPHRRFEGERLVLATHNPGKLVELQMLLEPHGVRLVSAGELGLPEPEETGSTFIENARIKAKAATRGSGLPALADDSGLSVAGLDGAPGIYSARWAGPGRDFAAAMARVLRQLAERYGSFEAADQRAAFVSALCLAWPDGHTETFEGRVEGRLVPAPRGSRGFGYDPIFLPEGGLETYGELDPLVKHATSHRARAFQALLAACFKPLPRAADDGI
jgi:XTP/dITP diphosphohydrolase